MGQWGSRLHLVWTEDARSGERPLRELAHFVRETAELDPSILEGVQLVVKAACRLAEDDFFAVAHYATSGIASVDYELRGVDDGAVIVAGVVGGDDYALVAG